ncbi:baseplate multidomain protein megatron [Pseudooceanicola spongiae]|uniref:Host specificity protein n=1 Tax=Pseudooceanicola spongiae TaxID=2613965 RepID=A0A7L9WIY4_9RHOB|nr:glycoside hydrolase/phage tail family protein [Pseudooceanicola spongiae]QOL79794.1 host specificity protein [Pseudooceanicola spongiae]
MATILLSAAGAAIGGTVGGSVLGLSAAVTGRFAGALLGRVIDQRIIGAGSDAVETGRVARFRLTGAGEGDALPRVYGRMRIAGQVIWASQFSEVSTTSGGGKGAPRPPKVANFSYSVNLGIGLCEGQISGVGRIWADGAEVSPEMLNIRVYGGSTTQLPDPKMEAIEGAGKVPAYRGSAYVVMEDLDLAPFGNRIPQFTFEVLRPAPVSLAGANTEPAFAIRGVALMPGSGEYALATSAVSYDYGAGRGALANVNSPSGKSDLATSLDQLNTSLPNCEAASLIVSWFGDDLRCGSCTIRPKVEQNEHDGTEMPWQVAGVDRSSAQVVAQDNEGRPIYGGTPTDASVIEAIEALNAQGKAVMFYPFMLMDQGSGNVLPNPYSGSAGQPALPWRGRITGSVAPNQPGTPDGTAAQAVEVSAFFGTADASDFAITPGQVVYTGPAEWRYRRFILHCAALCAAAGGVDSFCIGSEMRGLTQLRGAANSFPAVVALRALAAEVRSILGAGTKIGYAADWTEYFGYQPEDASGDRFFHLDPLWADANIDFVGIDNYMPLSDWRDGDDHLDAASHTSIYDPSFLMGNIEGGELFDWYYASDADRAAQLRTPITDGAYGEPWVYRIKDVANWWQNAHHDRIAGVRQASATSWVPQSKPIWFTELGCAAIDKGTNQPNKFLDPKSSESALPFHSNGQRDDTIQMQYLRAMYGYWSDPSHNPSSAVYGGPMIDMSRGFVWAWDARPFPFFPNNRALWSDGANYHAGHWINGRASNRSLALIVAEICEDAGLTHYDVSGLYGSVSGYLADDGGEARRTLQPLMLRYGFDAVEREGQIVFRMRTGRATATVDASEVALHADVEGRIEHQRAAEAELAGRMRLKFIEAEADFAAITEEAILPDETSRAVAGSEMPLAMWRGEGRQVVERWLTESRVARDTLRLALPPSRCDIGAGDVISLTEAGQSAPYRIDRAEVGTATLIEGVRVKPQVYLPGKIDADPPSSLPFRAPLPVLPLFLDLPLMRGDEVPHAPHLAVTSDPWPGSVALYSSGSDSGYALDQVIPVRATVGVTTTPLARGPVGRIDLGTPLGVELTSGSVSSTDTAGLLSGRNLLAIGDGTPEAWEVLQFRDATLTAPGHYLLSHRLRGQLGTETMMPDVWPVGTYIVLLDGIPDQIPLAPNQRGLQRHYRIGPANRSPDDPSYRHLVQAFNGVGLRPYAPCHLRVASGVPGDLHFTWIRRTRTGGDSWSAPDVPLGEESQSFLISIRSAGALVRQLFTDQPQWTYSALDRSADGLSGAAEIEVAQVSASYGAGPSATLSFTA